MLKKNLFLVISLFAFTTNEIACEAYLTANYRDLLSYSSPNTLIVTDINGVLIQSLASDNGKGRKIELVDADTPLVIACLQQGKTPLIGLTCQPCKRADAQHEELLSVSIDLSINPIQERNRTPLRNYRHGILFCGASGDKGKILRTFLAEVYFRPELIVFIDDTLENLQSVESAAEVLGIPFVGLHYCSKENISSL